MNKHIATKAAKYVQLSGALTKRALAELGPLQADAKKAAAATPALLDSLMSSNMINVTTKEAAAKLLRTREGTQTLLKEAAKVVARLAANQKEAGDIGSPADPVAAGLTRETAGKYDSLTSPFVGSHTSEKKASDLAYERILLG